MGRDLIILNIQTGWGLFSGLRRLAILVPLVSCVPGPLAESSRDFELTGLSWQLRGMGQPFPGLPGPPLPHLSHGALAATLQDHGEKGMRGWEIPSTDAEAQALGLLLCLPQTQPVCINVVSIPQVPLVL